MWYENIVKIHLSNIIHSFEFCLKRNRQMGHLLFIGKFNPELNGEKVTNLCKFNSMQIADATK